jgi:trimeric autotransporter adhesin
LEGISITSRRLLSRRAIAAAVAAAGVLVGYSAPIAPASLGAHVAQHAVRGWQVPAPDWTPSNKEAGRVDDLLRVGRRLYVAGNFTELANHAGRSVRRTYLASVRASTGRLGGFAPRIDGRVFALAKAHGLLFVGGAFSSVNGHARHNLAAFSLRTGKLSRHVRDLHIRGAVEALAATGRTVFVGGSFSSVSGRSRGKLAKLTLRGGRYRVARGWRPRANAMVRAIVVVSSRRVVAGGDFTAVSGSPQRYMAALGARGRGRVKRWRSHPQAEILDLARAGKAIYAAEAGSGGTALKFGARRGKQKWFYKTDGNVQAVTVVGRSPVFGMHGDNVAPRKNRSMSEFGHTRRIQRHKIFMLSRKGKLRSWNPDLTSTEGVLGVWALCAGAGNVYAGGDFTAVHGMTQQRLAIFRHV